MKTIKPVCENKNCFNCRSVLENVKRYRKIMAVIQNEIEFKINILRSLHEKGKKLHSAGDNAARIRRENLDKINRGFYGTPNPDAEEFLHSIFDDYTYPPESYETTEPPKKKDKSPRRNGNLIEFPEQPRAIKGGAQ